MSVQIVDWVFLSMGEAGKTHMTAPVSTRNEVLFSRSLIERVLVELMPVESAASFPAISFP